jgi:hypothetical protein
LSVGRDHPFEEALGERVVVEDVRLASLSHRIRCGSLDMI